MRLLFALILIAVVLLVRPAWSATRCLTYEEKALGRLHTVCSDGTRAVSTWNKTLSRWESTVTPPTSRHHDDKWRPHPKAWGR